MMKRLTAALLVLAMLIALVSCSSERNTLSPKNETEIVIAPDTDDTESEVVISESETSSEDTEDHDSDQNTVSVRKLGVICLEKTVFGETELAINCTHYGIDRASVESYQVEYISYAKGPEEQFLVTNSLINEGYETIIFDVFSFLHYELLPLIRINTELIEMDHDNVKIYVPEDEDAASEESETAETESEHPESEGEDTEESESEDIQEDGSVQETDLSKVWPGKEYTWNVTDANGYKLQCKMRYGVWIKASDTESLNAAWHAVGGKGDAPDIKDFNAYHLNDQVFRADKSVMTFCTFEMQNMTKGYDFTPEFPYKVMLNYISDPQLEVDSELGSWQGAMYFTNSVSYLHMFSTSIISTTMKKNHWGPVPVVYAVANVFGPKFGDNGNEALDDVYFRMGGFTPESQKIYIPALWKN